MLNSLILWVTSWSSSPYGPVALFVIAFAESSFFPIPPDVLLIPLALLRIKLAFFFAFITTLGSVIGGAFGYLIGRKGGRPVLDRFFKQESILAVEKYYNRYDWWAILVAAFTPIPYKVFTISAGAFKLDFWRFLLASTVGRGGRFFLVALFIVMFGPAAQELLNEHFNLFTLVFMVLLVAGFVAAKWMFGRGVANNDK